MYHQERQLQLLRQRFIKWLPYLKNATKAEVRIAPLAQGNAFFIVANWEPGKEYKKLYDAATVLRQGRVRCVKDYAMVFVQEVLQERGVL